MTVFLCDVSGSTYGNPGKVADGTCLLDDMKDRIDKMGGMMDRVICFDSLVYEAQPIADFFRKHPYGGGGTDIKAAVEAGFAEAEEDEDIVMLTDDYFQQGDVPDSIQVLLFGR